MIAFTPEAERQVKDLRRLYDERERVEVIRAVRREFQILRY